MNRLMNRHMKDYLVSIIQNNEIIHSDSTGDTRSLPIPLSFTFLGVIILAASLQVTILTISLRVIMRRRGNTRGKERNTQKKTDPMVAWKDDSFESEASNKINL